MGMFKKIKYFICCKSISKLIPYQLLRHVIKLNRMYFSYDRTRSAALYQLKESTYDNTHNFDF